MSGEVVDALRVAVEALVAAGDELDLIAEGGPEGHPVPDDLQRILDEHAAMKDVLGRLREMTSAEGRVRLLNLYRDAVLRCHGSYEMPSGYPVLAEVRQAVGEARESLRRLELSSGEVRDALEGVMT